MIAVPGDWIDVQTLADLEEVSFDFRDKKIQDYELQPNILI